jgi:GR25 family glycosyltransferase involved in LPS biosynthesis
LKQIEILNKLYEDANILDIISKKLKVNKNLVLDSHHEVYIIIYNMIIKNRSIKLTKGYIISSVYRYYLNTLKNNKLVELKEEIKADELILQNQDKLASILSKGEWSNEELYLIRARMYKLENWKETSIKLNKTMNQL